MLSHIRLAKSDKILIELKSAQSVFNLLVAISLIDVIATATAPRTKF